MATTNTIGTFVSFNQDSDDWKTYEEVLDAFFDVNDIEDEKRSSYLIAGMGLDSYKTLRDLCHPALPKDKPFEELSDLLRKHFSPQVAIFRERITFFKAKQNYGENITSWYARMKSLSVDCQFGEHLEEMLLNKFVSGLKKGQVLDRLCEEGADLTLEKAIDIALKKESSLVDSDDDDDDHHGPPHFGKHHGGHHGPPHFGGHHGRPHHGEHHGPPHFGGHHGEHHGPPSFGGYHGEHHGPPHFGGHHGRPHHGEHHGPPHFGEHHGRPHHGEHHGPPPFGGHHGEHHGPPHHGRPHHGEHHGPPHGSENGSEDGSQHEQDGPPAEENFGPAVCSMAFSAPSGAQCKRGMKGPPKESGGHKRGARGCGKRGGPKRKEQNWRSQPMDE